LGDEKPRAGKYTVVYEFMGVQSPAVSFVVEEVSELSKITGEFVFPSPLDLGRPGVVALVVRNGTSETIRFPHRGQTTGMVWGNLKRTTPPTRSSAYFVSDAVLRAAAGVPASGSAELTFTRDSINRIPTVTLRPGETYRLELNASD